MWLFFLKTRFMYLKGGVTEIETEREIFHVLVYIQMATERRLRPGS